MKWFAKLSNNDVIGEYDSTDIKAKNATWSGLREHCEKNYLWIEDLFLVVNGKEYHCKTKAQGYWHACLIFAACGAGISKDSKGLIARLESKAIGYAEGDNVYIICATPDGRVWEDPPRTITQAGEQIIWAPTLKNLHGGANERTINIDSKLYRQSDGELIKPADISLLKVTLDKL
jgi:hypothetical protein